MASVSPAFVPANAEPRPAESASPAVLPANANTNPAGKGIYRPALDALRLFAFLAVWLHHSLVPGARTTGIHHWIPWLHDVSGLGLCLFFFLSSYLITSLLKLEKERTGSVHLKKFYVRRTLRIWPLYLFSLALCWVLGLRFEVFRSEPLRLVAMLSLAGNWFAVFFGMGNAVLAQLWSISVEEQFYLVWPALSRVLSAAGLLRMSCALCVAGLATTWGLAAHGSSSLSIWLNSLVQCLFFAAGGLLALKLDIRRQRHSLLRALFLIGGGLVVWAGTTAFAPVTVRTSGVVPWRITTGYALTAVGCALLLSGFLYLPEKLLPGWILYLGRISYGLYVYHPLVVVSMAAIALHLRGKVPIPQGGLSLLVTVGVASLSYEFMEKRFLKPKYRLELVPTGLRDGRARPPEASVRSA